MANGVRHSSDRRLPIVIALVGSWGKRYHIKFTIVYHTLGAEFCGTLCKLTRIPPDPSVITSRMKVAMPIRPLFLLFLALVAPLRAADTAAPTTQRVFVCTHSFMQFTSKMLPAIAKTAGITQISAGEQMIGGSTCIQHWNLPDDKNKAKAALSAGNVDVLTLSPFYIMPDPGIENYVKLGVAKNPNLRVFVQASWPAFDSADGMPKQHVQGERNKATVASLRALHDAQNSKWRKDLQGQIAALNKELGREVVKLIPVNDAVFALRSLVIDGKVPGITQQTDLFKDDIGHPTPPLALLVTYCHLAAIYGKSPVGLPVPGSLKEKPEAEALAKVLQEVAWEAVKGYGKKESAASK